MKKFTALFICLLMVITCGLAGCAGFSIDKVKYYNEVLATIGDTHITRYDLLSAYNSYGQSYFVQQEGKSEEEALSSTLDLLIDREALYLYASNSENDSTYKPTKYQVNSIVDEILSGLDGQMESYVETAKKMLKITSETSNEDEKEDEKAYLYSNYAKNKDNTRAYVVDEVKTKRVYFEDSSKETETDQITSWYEDREYIESRIQYNQERLAEPKDSDYEKLLSDEYLGNHRAAGIITAIKNKYFSLDSTNKGKFIKDLEEKEAENALAIYNKVITLFTNDLLDYEQYLRDENGKEYSKNNDDLIYRYIERTFDSQIQSQYIENMRTKYLLDEQSELSINKLIDRFESLYTRSFNSYNKKYENYKKAMKDAGTNADSILYHPQVNDATSEQENTQFGYFIHSLINFNDYQKKAYERMKKLPKNQQTDALAEIINMFDPSYESVNPEYVNLINPRGEDGVVDTSVQQSLQDVVDYYNTYVNKPGLSYEAKLNAFIQFMFKYTGDTATLSAGMPYVVGTNGYSAMEQAFTDECVKLMKTGNKGTMSNVDLLNVNNLCVTSYGIHIVMYVGEVDAYDVALGDVDAVYIAENNRDYDGSGAYNLFTKTLNPLTGKTYFDMLFDAVYPESGDAKVFTSVTGYSEEESNIAESAKKTYGCKKYTTKIKGTKTSI